MADSVFGDLGGPGTQSAGPAVPGIGDGARNALGNPSGNPSGNHGEVPAQGSVFGDLGGVGTQSATTTAPEPGSGDFPAY